MADLVKRLRSITRHPAMGGCHMVNDEITDAAADRIEQLERELVEMTKLKDSHAEMRSVYFEQLATEKALEDRLQDDLFGIEVYASDTLSGPSEGVPDLKWILDGVSELHDRAVKGRAAHRKARGGVMELKEAIEEVKEYKNGFDNFGYGNFVHGAAFDVVLATAIATILNAVVKGELRAEEKQDHYWKTY